MIRYLSSFVRSIALLGLAFVGLLGPVVAFLVAFVLLTLGISFFLGPVVERARSYLNPLRRLIGGWCATEIPVPYIPAPPEPEREADGWYREGNSLYETPKRIRHQRRMEWVFEDVATGRDVAWLLINPLVSLLLPIAALVAGPAALRGYGRLAGRWLGPATSERRKPRWLYRQFAGFGCLIAQFLGSFAPLAVSLSVLVTLPLPFATVTVKVARAVTGVIRHIAGEWTGVVIESPYLPPPAFPVPRGDGLYQSGRRLYDTPLWPDLAARLRWIRRDPATWRDLAAAVLNPIVTGLLLFPPLALVLAFVWLPYVDGFPEGLVYVAEVPLFAAGIVASPPLAKLQAKFEKLLLGPTESARLAQRVERLERTRTDATDAQAEELRRIERDLHDGVQSRLVAMGMKLGAVEALIDSDPGQAKKLAADLRKASSDALTELREVVRGVHPPVLSERGLPDAVRALALDSPLRVEVTVDLPGRCPLPIEACFYFAISELLGNAVKHGYARRASIDLSYRLGRVTGVVTDEGHGGATPGGGSGLRGIERRLAAFDGKLTIQSPLGGPTKVTMEIPCQLDQGR